MTPERLRLYPSAIALAYLILAAVLFARAFDETRGGQAPFVTDFNTFYAVSALTLDGRAAEAYGRAQLYPAEQAAVEAFHGPLGAEQKAGIPYFRWMYPPTALLLVAPLALLPYAAAYLGWVGLTLAAYAAALRRLSPLPWVVWLAFPAVFLNGMFGQNGLLSTALLAVGLGTLPRRPVLAGLALGLLAYKPQLAVLIPLALAAGGQWRSFLAAGVSALAAAVLSLAVLGPEPWLAFLANSGGDGTGIMERGEVPWGLMPTIFPAIRLLGGPVMLAYGVQAACAVGAIAVLFWLWRRPVAFELKAASLVPATLLATPFAHAYDLAILAVPMAFLAAEMGRQPARRWELAVLAAAFVLPLAGPGIAKLGLPVAPLVNAALLGLVVQRACSAKPQ